MTKAVNTLLPLADVRSYDIPSAWPLSLPWWLLIISIVALLIIVTMLLRHRLQRNRAKKEALSLIMSDEIRHDPVKMLELVKRAVYSYFPREQMAHLSGDELYAYLDRLYPSTQLSESFQANNQLWQKAIYSPDPLTDEETACCQKICQQWINGALPPSKELLHTLNAEVAHV